MDNFYLVSKFEEGKGYCNRVSLVTEICYILTHGRLYAISLVLAITGELEVCGEFALGRNPPRQYLTRPHFTLPKADTPRQHLCIAENDCAYIMTMKFNVVNLQLVLESGF